MAEFVPNAEEMVNGWLRDGRTLEGAQSLLEVVEKGNENGYLRDDIPCQEYRERFLDMAECMYVRNEPPTSRPIKDYELGAHEARCEDENCQLLSRIYWLILRPSRPEQAETNAHILQAARDKLDGLPDEE